MPFRPDNVEGFVNGVRATDIRLAPGWTQYEKRVQYQAYDVTALLQPGDNVVAADELDVRTQTALLGGSLAFAEARLDTPYGEIASRWERTSDGVAYVFTVPANTTAELVLPGEKPLALPPGAHRFARPA